MSIIREFRKFVGFKVIEYFLLHPTREIHLKELARRLEVSPRSVKIYCDLFEEEGILVSERKGNMRVFRLNNDSFAVRELKRAYHLLLLKESGIERLCKACTIAVYGSFASGEVDERSDLDILVIGDEEEIDYDLLREIEERTGRDVQITVIPFHRWEAMKREKNQFVESVVRRHVLVRGTPL